MEEDEWEKRQRELEAAVIPRLTDEFLETLALLVRTDIGSDWIEIHGWARDCFHLAGKEPPADMDKLLNPLPPL